MRKAKVLDIFIVASIVVLSMALVSWAGSLSYTSPPATYEEGDVNRFAADVANLASATSATNSASAQNNPGDYITHYTCPIVLTNTADDASGTVNIQVSADNSTWVTDYSYAFSESNSAQSIVLTNATVLTRYLRTNLSAIQNGSLYINCMVSQ